MLVLPVANSIEIFLILLLPKYSLDEKVLSSVQRWCARAVRERRSRESVESDSHGSSSLTVTDILTDRSDQIYISPEHRSV